jgi:hypothetical protein
MSLLFQYAPSPLEGAAATVANGCARLGIHPPLLPAQRITWRGWDTAKTRGINAQVAHFAPEDEEPYVWSIAVYEQVRVPAPPGCDYGVDNRAVAILDFVLDAAAAHPTPVTGDPLRVPLRLAWVDLDPALAERTLAEVLDELRQLLAGWPVTREEGAG